MIQRTFQSICLISLWSSQTFSIIFAKKTQKKMTLLSEKPELRSEFSKFAPDHRFEIKHGNNGLKFSNNFAFDSNIKIPNVPRKTENPSLIPPDVWSSIVSSRDDLRKDVITLPEEHPYEPWHLLQEEPEAPRKSRRQRARERDGFRRYPPPRTKDSGRRRKPRPGKRARQRGEFGNDDLRRSRNQKEVPRGPWERGRDGRGSRSREDDPRRSWSQRDEPRQPWSRRDEPRQPWSRRDEPQQPWDRRDEPRQPWSQRDESRRPWSSRDEPRQPWSRRDEPRQPWNRRDEPRQPWSGRDEPQRPWDYRDEPQRPWDHRDEPQRPWDHRDEPQRPWDHRDEPQRVPGRTGQAQRSWGRREEPRQPWSSEDEPQRPRSQRNRPERPWDRGNEEQRSWDRRRYVQRPWDQKDIKRARKLAKRRIRNGLRQRLAQERRAEKLKKEGVSEASPSRKSEGQEPKSTLAWRTTNRETRVERKTTRVERLTTRVERATTRVERATTRVERPTTTQYPRTRKYDISQRPIEWREQGPWTPEAWTRNTWPWGGWTKKPKRTIMTRASTPHPNTAASQP
nr:PREDICTED: eukaryotic translation initiation factor 3 subunit A-like [Bemisia tabaci]XP_018915612.1 PREDICTED: eukaryotic translation initiation factor 3 subunit A-like [Bemisia tabaci]